MNKKFTIIEVSTLSYFIMRAFYIGITFNFLIQNSLRDGWLTILLCIIPSLIYINFIIKFMNYKPNLSFTEKINSIFKYPKVILILISLFFLFLSILNFMNLNNLIHSQFLNKTPIFIISLVFIVAIFYVLIKGIKSISRVGLILFYFSMILVVITVLGLIKIVDLTNLMPVFQTSITSHLKGMSSIMAYNIFPLILITIIPENKISENKKIKKYIIISYIISTIIMLLVGILTIGSFGFELTKVYEYPEFHVLKNIVVFGMQAKIDNILALQWLFDMFIFIVLSIYLMVENIKDNLNINKNLLYIIICLIIFISTLYIYKFNIPFNDIFVDYAHYFINLIFIIFSFISYIKIKKQS